MAKDIIKNIMGKAIAYTRASRAYNNKTIITDNYYIIDYKIGVEKLIEAIMGH